MYSGCKQFLFAKCYGMFRSMSFNECQLMHLNDVMEIAIIRHTYISMYEIHYSNTYIQTSAFMIYEYACALTWTRLT